VNRPSNDQRWSSYRALRHIDIQHLHSRLKQAGDIQMTISGIINPAISTKPRLIPTCSPYARRLMGHFAPASPLPTGSRTGHVCSTRLRYFLSLRSTVFSSDPLLQIRGGKCLLSPSPVTHSLPVLSAASQSCHEVFTSASTAPALTTCSFLFTLFIHHTWIRTISLFILTLHHSPFVSDIVVVDLSTLYTPLSVSTSHFLV
jgi:hypothetical protein